jgi:TonB family protein
MRARSLAAAGKLAAAASELEGLRTSSADQSVRDVACILLMWIYVEMPDYTRAGALLDETFRAHDAPGQPEQRAYFALAGQTINSVRTHLDRYRTFGIDISDPALPSESANDLQQLRQLLEKVVGQARAIRDEEIKIGGRVKSTDATALLEDAATVRLRLARSDQEQADWQREVADARQRLVATEIRIASIGGLPAGVPQTSARIASPAPNGASNSSVGAALSPTAAATRDKPAQEKSNSKPKSSSKERTAPAKETTKNSAAPARPEAPQQAEKTSDETPPLSTKGDGKPVAVGALAPRATQKVSPTYPPIAKTARVSGLVTVYVVVDEKGAVEAVQRADGPMQLQGAAAEAARRWKFHPTLVDGQPVRVAGYISFNFSL